MESLNEMVVGIIGSRRRNTLSDKKLIEEELIKLINEYGRDNIKICSGGCSKGGDRFAEILASEYKIPILIHRAKWGEQGRIAGFIRNSYIAKDSDILIAVVSNDRTGGTEDTIKKFKKDKPFGEVIFL